MFGYEQTVSFFERVCVQAYCKRIYKRTRTLMVFSCAITVFFVILSTMFYEIALIFRSVEKITATTWKITMTIAQEMRGKNGGYEVNRIVVSWMIAFLANYLFFGKRKKLRRSFDSRRSTPRKVLRFYLPLFATRLIILINNGTLRRSDAKQSYQRGNFVILRNYVLATAL